MRIVRLSTAMVAAALCLMLAGCLSLSGSGNDADSGIWFDCVLSTARRTATGPGSAADIADAALAACKPQEDDFAKKIQVLYPGASPQISVWRADIRERAMTAVVEIRSDHSLSSPGS